MPRDGAGRRWFTAAIFVLLGLSPSAPAGAEPVNPGVPIEFMRSAYSGGPTAERVTVTVETPSRGGMTRRFLVYVRPGEDLRGADASVLLILAGSASEGAHLTVAAGRDGLIAVNSRDDSSYYAAAYEGLPDAANLKAALPPLPLPQLDLAFGDVREDGWTVTPYTPSVRFTSADYDARRGRFTLEGRDARGSSVVLSCTEEGRLESIRCEIEPRGEVLGLKFAPVDPLSASSMVIGTEGRERVESLGLLAAPTPMGVGGTLSDMALISIGGERWSEPLEGAVENAPEKTRAYLFVRWNFLRPDGPQLAEDRLARLKRTVDAIVPELPASARWRLVLSGATEPIAAADLEALSGVLAGVPGGERVELLRARSARESIARLDPQASVVLVLTDGVGVIRHIFDLDDAFGEAESLRSLVRPPPAADGE